MTGTAGSTAAKQAVSDKKNAAIPFAGKMWKEAEIGEPYKQFLEKRGIRLYVSGETRWKEKKSRGGKAYRLAKVKAGLYTGGCLIPFLRKGSSWKMVTVRHTYSLQVIRNQGHTLCLMWKKRHGR